MLRAVVDRLLRRFANPKAGGDDVVGVVVDDDNDGSTGRGVVKAALGTTAKATRRQDKENLMVRLVVASGVAVCDGAMSSH